MAPGTCNHGAMVGAPGITTSTTNPDPRIAAHERDCVRPVMFSHPTTWDRRVVCCATCGKQITP